MFETVQRIYWVPDEKKGSGYLQLIYANGKRANYYVNRALARGLLLQVIDSL